MTRRKSQERKKKRRTSNKVSEDMHTCYTCVMIVCLKSSVVYSVELMDMPLGELQKLRGKIGTKK